MSAAQQFSARRRPGPILGLAAVALVTLAAGCASAATTRDVSRAPGQSRPTADPAPFSEAFTPEQARRISQAQAHVRQSAGEYELDPHLVNAVIWVESRFVPDAKSPAGARGLMQLMPATATGLAKQLGERRPRSYDPAFNVRAGSYYLRRLIDRFDGDLELALASYNAGAGNVNKWVESGAGLPDHSRDYVAKVLEARARFAGTSVDAPSVAPVPTETTMENKDTLAEGSQPSQAELEQPGRALPTATPSVSLHANGPVENFEPVFEPHPELDANPAPTSPPTPTAAESGEGTPPPDSDGDLEPTLGKGVLPGVGD